MDLSFLCTVQEIAGDYAILISESGNERQVALALLPEDLQEGDKLLFENFQYRKP